MISLQGHWLGIEEPSWEVSTLRLTIVAIQALALAKVPANRDNVSIYGSFRVDLESQSIRMYCFGL